MLVCVAELVIVNDIITNLKLHFKIVLCFSCVDMIDYIDNMMHHSYRVAP